MLKRFGRDGYYCMIMLQNCSKKGAKCFCSVLGENVLIFLIIEDVVPEKYDVGDIFLPISLGSTLLLVFCTGAFSSGNACSSALQCVAAF